MVTNMMTRMIRFFFSLFSRAWRNPPRRRAAVEFNCAHSLEPDGVVDRRAEIYIQVN